MISIYQDERQINYGNSKICKDTDCYICGVGTCLDSNYDCNTEISKAKHCLIQLCKMKGVDFYTLNSHLYRDSIEVDKRLEKYATDLLQYVKEYNKFQLHCTELIFIQTKLSCIANINMIHKHFNLDKNPNKEYKCHDAFSFTKRYDLKKYKVDFEFAKKYFVWHCEMNSNYYFSNCDKETDKALKLNRYSFYFLRYLVEYYAFVKGIEDKKIKFLEKKLSKFIKIDYIFEYYELNDYGGIPYTEKWVKNHFFSLGLRYMGNYDNFQETMSQMGVRVTKLYGRLHYSKINSSNTKVQYRDFEHVTGRVDQKNNGYMDHTKLLDIKKIVRKQHAPYIDIFKHINKICHEKSNLLHNIVAFKKVAHESNLVNDIVELIFIELKKIYIENYGESLFITHEYFTEKILGIKPEESCNCYITKNGITFVDVRNISTVDKNVKELDHDWLRINCQGCRNKYNDDWSSTQLPFS